ncbi:MAG: citrate lyase holo-[acyl-carrier protein] synthase [Clostridia bacterium]|nr:citrate lyase holo-[acyl-carrier protein] synthase [Clostridia bacterium]
MENVALEQVLLARERRAAARRRLLDVYPGAAVVCLGVNMPGPVKRTPAAERVFYAGLRALRAALPAALVCAEERVDAPTGLEARFAVAEDVMTLKKLACALEEGLAFGRLLDIDVAGRDGLPVPRAAAGLRPRACLVCGREGAYCASRRLHPLDELIAAFNALAAHAPEEGPC